MSRRNRTHRHWQATLAAIASIAMVTVGSSQAMPPQGPSAPAADQDIVKRHLTAARNLLSDVTELPAAAQLTGDTRVEVQRLITNFNELIAPGSDWRGSYAKVDANLDSLLAPTGSPSAGAVGTSGTPALALDVSIREKLVEFRAELDRFEAAAAGTLTRNSPRGQPPAPAPGPGTGMSQELVHVEAIEVILESQVSAQKAATASAGAAVTSSETASGSTRTTVTNPDVTLSAGQLAQIRGHLTALRRLLDRK
jgi:hypothetical protein